jgi:hypothetical protein
MFAGAVEPNSHGFARLIRGFGPQFGLEDFIDECGDGHYEEFEDNHTAAPFLWGPAPAGHVRGVPFSRASGWGKRCGGALEHERN